MQLPQRGYRDGPDRRVAAPFVLIMIGPCWAPLVDSRRDPERRSTQGPVSQQARINEPITSARMADGGGRVTVPIRHE